MKHTMIDCYGANEHQLDNMKLISQLLTEVVYDLGLNPICPVSIIPYYYGKVKEDIGISAYILLEGGHITIHTFPIRECYFIDCFSSDNFDEKKLYNFFLEELPFIEKKSFLNTTLRESGQFNNIEYNPTFDFGPHLMAEINSSKSLNMDELFGFLENTAYDINMDPITRACVMKSTISNPRYLSGIIVIAQSHIALHYEYLTKKIYFDIFSCMPFDYTVVNNVVSSLGEVLSNELIPRGTKHIYKVKSDVEKDELLANTKWQKIVNNK
ncbi:MAG: S-adenosylmethionine decarboxylase [Bacilli bacterium]|nr:S-adenosylmethionine decarboxylase [Bacilli bacterium]